jgi:two-component system phosphate regulon sensor histidine kinase PhoR
MGNFKDKEEAIIESPFQFSVDKLYRPSDYVFSVYFPAKRSILLRQMEIWLLLSVFFLIVLIVSFIYVIFSIFQQKKLSEMKNDFINNMTHEFKTPLATSSLAAEMILRTEMIKNPNRIKKYAKVIMDENMRLQGQVEQVLQMATLENSEHQFKFKKTNIHSLLESVIDSFELRIKENKIKIITHLNAQIPIIFADRVHTLNVFYNLMDNAIKYTPENPVIKIETWNNSKGIHIRISDNGIGIDLANQKDVFKNLYRVPTGDIHEVRGFGLGLYYVKTVVDYHHGNIQLNSELKKGASFDVFLPFNEKKSM